MFPETTLMVLIPDFVLQMLSVSESHQVYPQKLSALSQHHLPPALSHLPRA